MKTEHNSKNKLIIIAGPTGVGKSNISLKLAQSMHCEIIGADSRQLYQEMSIGTAKSSPKDLEIVKHHMVDSHSINQEITTSQYEKQTLEILNSVFKQHNVAILTGGTGLYIKSVVEGLDELAPPNLILRNELETGYAEHGIDYLQDYLKELDLATFEKIDIQNSRRLIRSIEILKSDFIPKGKSKKEPRDFTPIPICITMDRGLLYDRINTRVDQMMSDGLLKEVESLMEHRQLKSMQTVGYSELFKYLDGDIDLDTAIELIKRNSRRYAKRQMTWFRNQGEWKNFSADNYSGILEYINTQLI